MCVSTIICIHGICRGFNRLEDEGTNRTAPQVLNIITQKVIV